MGARPQMRSSGQAFILRTLRGGVGGLQGSVRGGGSVAGQHVQESP